MADFDFLDGFDADGDWGFSSVAEKPSGKTQSDTETTKAVVKQTADGVGKAVSKEVLATIEGKMIESIQQSILLNLKFKKRIKLNLILLKSKWMMNMI